MKSKVLLISTIACALLIGCSSKKLDNPWDTKLPFKTAIIEYTMSGSQNGTETLYIKDYGKQRAKHTNAESKVLFMKTKINTIEITTPDWITSVNITDKNGSKMPHPQKQDRNAFEKLSKKEKATVIDNLEKIKEKGFGMQSQKGEFLGESCDITTAAGVTMYVIEGTDIPLKSDVSVMGMKTSIVATKINKNVDIPDDKFIIPTTISVAINNQMNQMAQQMNPYSIDKLKDPDFEKKYLSPKA